MGKLDLSQLPGTYRTSVFVGGSYAEDSRIFLGLLRKAMKKSGFHPVLAYDYKMPKVKGDVVNRDIHDVTLWLLHSCRLAVFETSEWSGALMEIERMADYGFHRALLLYYERHGQSWKTSPKAWKTSTMLKSYVLEHDNWLQVSVYTRPKDAVRQTREFLETMRRSDHGKLHSL